MKIATLTMVYNNREFIEPCLNALEGFSDQIIVVEGAWNPELNSRSNDGTCEFLESWGHDHSNMPWSCKHEPYFGEAEIIGESGHIGPSYFMISPENKNRTLIHYSASQWLNLPQTNTYRPIVLANEIKARQFGLDQVHEDIDWIMIVDSDEVYTQEELRNLRSFLEDYNDIKESVGVRFYIPSFVFYFNYSFGTRETYRRISGVQKGQKLILDYTDSIEYPKDMDIISDTIPEDICLMKHYGYIGEERIRTKLTMWDQQEGNNWWENVAKPALQGKLDKTNYHLFARKLGYGANQKFEKFNGEHPESIKCLIK